MPLTPAQVRARNPYKDAMVGQLADYEDEPLAPVPPPPEAPAVAAPPPPPVYQARVNPDGSVEAPEPGEVGYVPPGGAQPYRPPNGNTGITGGIDTSNQTGTLQPVGNTGTTLMEGDPSKFNDQHYASSPKYQFLSRATQYGRGQENDLLNSLKQDYGAHWNGWEFDGRGNFVFKGNPNQLHPDWKGVTSVDAYGGYNDGGALQARWGAGELDDSGPGATSSPTVAGTLPNPVGTQVPAAPTSPTATTPAAAAPSPTENAFQAALVKLLGAPDPTMDDPAIKAQSQANAVAQQRSAERRRAAAAEQRSSAGQMGGALASDVDNILSAQGDAVGAFDAGLLGDAQERKDRNVIAALGPALAEMGLSQQDRQFVIDRAQNDRQFLQQLSATLGIAEGRLNLDSMIALLNGL